MSDAEALAWWNAIAAIVKEESSNFRNMLPTDIGSMTMGKLRP